MNQKDFTVVITHAIPKPGLERLYEECTVYYPEHAPVYSDEELMKILPECDAVLAGGALTREMIGCAKKLKIISNYGAGYDRVDVDAADEAGVKGKHITPFLLAHIVELTGGDSLKTNMQLAFNNARTAAKIAVAYSQM